MSENNTTVFGSEEESVIEEVSFGSSKNSFLGLDFNSLITVLRVQSFAGFLIKLCWILFLSVVAELLRCWVVAEEEVSSWQKESIIIPSPKSIIFALLILSSSVGVIDDGVEARGERNVEESTAANTSYDFCA